MSKTTDKIQELQRLLGDTSPIVSDVLTLALREITKLTMVEPKPVERVKSGSVKDGVKDETAF